MQLASLAHEAGQLPELPLQTSGAHEGLPAERATTFVQVPIDATRSQASQAPVHEALQQTPSAQNPLPHSSPAPQTAPSPFFGVQAPLEQKLPAAQAAPDAQVAGQAAAEPLQT